MNPSPDALRARLAVAEGVILLEDAGASAVLLAQARRRYHREGLELRSVRTARLRRVLPGTPFEVLVDACVGSLLLVVVDRVPAAAATLTSSIVRWSDDLRLRACAIAGERIELEAMTRAPSLHDRRAALLRVLTKPRRALLVTLAERDDLYFALDELQGLRRRLASLLAGPRVRDDDESRWYECRIDTEAIFASFASVRLRPGWQLRAYAFRQGGNGNGVIWALPPDAPDREPWGKRRGSLFDPPRPDRACSVTEAIEADEDHPWSHVCVSMLLREFSEYGALWHGVDWGAHHLVDELPAKDAWTVLEPLPRRLGPRMGRRGDAVVVVFHTVCREGTVRLIRHVDTYRSPSWRPTLERVVLAIAGPGYVC